MTPALRATLVSASLVVVLVLPGRFGNEVTEPKPALDHGVIEATITSEKESPDKSKQDKDDPTHGTNPSVNGDQKDEEKSEVNVDKQGTSNDDDLVSDEGFDDEYAECYDGEVDDDNEKDIKANNQKLLVSSENIPFDESTCRELWIKAKSLSKPCKSWGTLCKMKEGGCHIEEPLGLIGDGPIVSHTVFFEFEFHLIKSRIPKGLEKRCAFLKNKRRKVPTSPSSNTQVDKVDVDNPHGSEDSSPILYGDKTEDELIDEDNDDENDNEVDDECDDCDEEDEDYDEKVVAVEETNGKGNGKTNQDGTGGSETAQLDEKNCRDLWTKAKGFRRPCNSWSTLCKMMDGGCDLAEPLGAIGSHPEISHTIFFDQLEFYLIKSKSRKGLYERCADFKNLDNHSEAKLNEETCRELWVKAKSFERPCKSWGPLCKMKHGGCEITEPLGTIGHYPEISHTIFYETEFHLIKSRSSKGLDQRCAEHAYQN